MGLGSVAAAEGRNADAEHEFRLAVDAEPGYWRTYTALGNFLFQTGRGKEALALHRHAATLAQHDGVALNNIGASLFLSGQLDAAAGAWRAALELAPIAPTYSNLGATYYLLGDFDNAVAMYERSVALGPDDYRTWSNLADARAFALRGDAVAAYATAERLIERELALNSSDALARVGLAAVKAALGDTKAATEALDRALRDNATDDWQLHYVAAVADIRLGLAADAQPHIDAAIRAGYPKVLIDLDPALRALPGNPPRGNNEGTP
jgi:adenylate cyclase